MAPWWAVGVEVALELVAHVVGLAVVEAKVCAELCAADLTHIRDHTNAKVQSMQHVVRNPTSPLGVGGLERFLFQPPPSPARGRGLPLPLPPPLGLDGAGREG